MDDSKLALAHGPAAVAEPVDSPAAYWLDLYRAMLTARQIDRLEQELTSRGEAFFHVSGAGHEATASLARHLTPHDWLHCHYRDKALLLARGVSPRAFFDSLYCKDGSHSRGRQMSAHMSEPALNVLSIVGPVGNSALQAAGVAMAVRHREGSPIVLCSVGDGTTQQGEFLESCAEAVRHDLPLLFLVEDNRWAISTATRRKTFYSQPDGEPDEFYGMPIHRIDGRDAVETDLRFGEVVRWIRKRQQPAVIVLDVERLSNHTNADDQSIYRDHDEIQAAAAAGDPIASLEERLLVQGTPPSALDRIRREVEEAVALAEAESAASAEPRPAQTAKADISRELVLPSRERRGSGEGPRLLMRDALRETLRHHLRRDGRVTLYGQDIEDPKGDVFGVTKGLTSEFGRRVMNSPLTESTIVGVSVGRALAGERPVAFLQFADFVPLAYNQIISEMASMHWRTGGGWRAPVILMIACGGYRPGLGPFHAQTFESVMAHTPGVDVFMPSTAADAAGLLNAAFQSERPTIFFYPKSCLNDAEAATSSDVAEQFIPIGPCRRVRNGRDVTLVGWGNTVRLCQKGADALEKAGLDAEVLDLRSLSPWDEETVVASAEKTGRLIVVHEDNHTCGLGAEILATVAERAASPVVVRRITRADTFVPCNFANQIEVLPSFQRVLAAAAELLDLDLSWIAPPRQEAGVDYVAAIGSGPSDEAVQVVELLVRPGDRIERGDVVASLEATKSVFELTSSVSGEVAEVLAKEGDTVAVGAPLLKVLTGEEAGRIKPITQEQPGTPVLKRRTTGPVRARSSRRVEPRQLLVGISGMTAVEGGRLISNADLLRPFDGTLNKAGMSEADIVRLTGIERRRWIDDGETAVGMAVQASAELLDGEGISPDDIDVVICSTTSPPSVTPSMACQVLAGLTSGQQKVTAQAYDINAACSGYLYALQCGYDYLQSVPAARVLVVTAEVLSPLLDPHDLDTSILFGDAASATLLFGEDRMDAARGRVYRPDLSARGDHAEVLSVPLINRGYIKMNGRKVFSEAVRAMLTSLNRVCRREGLAVDELATIVPHQANQRIIDAIASRVGVSVYSNIREHGNTSSTSIPLCLREVLPDVQPGAMVGLCAFGGGFTFGAGIVERV